MHPAIWLSPLIAGLLILALCGWRREMGKRRARNQRKDSQPVTRNVRTARGDVLPEGAAPITGFNEPHTGSGGNQLLGGFMSVAVGTYGLNQLLRLLILLYQCGLEGLVGSIMVVEFDAQLRAKFHRKVPRVYHDRIVYAYADEYAGGLTSRPARWAMERIDIWGVPVERGVVDLIDMHLRRNGNRSPSDIWLFLSQGGHAPVGLPVVEPLHERFDEAQILGFTSLPKHRRLRGRYHELKEAYEAAGVHGWIIQDNLGSEPVTADFGMVALLVGLSEAALNTDHATQPNNAFALALTETPGAVLIYEVASETLAAFPYKPDPNGPERYYVTKQPVVSLTTKLMRKIDDGQGIRSSDLPTREDNTSLFDVVLQCIRRQDMTEIEDDVRAGRRLRFRYQVTPNGHLYGAEADYESVFASIATPINPQRPQCPVAVVRLLAVEDGAIIGSEIIKAPAERDLPGRQSSPITPLHPSLND